MDAIQPVTCINDIRNMATLIFYAILVTVVRKTSVGFCLLVGIGVQKLLVQQSNRTIICFSLLIVLLASGRRTIQRNNDWIDEEHLYRSGIEINPPSCNLTGEFLSARKRHDEAAEVYIQAVQIEPDSIAWTVAAAHALHDASRNVEAEVYFRRAVALVPMVS